MSLVYDDIVSLRKKLASKEVSPVEVTEALLERISQVDPKLNAYNYLNPEAALAQAKAADITKPLGGVPIAIKDVINVKGDPNTCASKILQGYIAPYDATVIAKLREAGAILLGRTNMDEFAMGSSTENSAWGVTRNPWDLDRIPGGSSGGSAAVVGGHEAFASLGSDTGGSIRQPAALCGCVGLKPTYGRVSRFGLTAFASSLDQIGPFTKTVADSALLLNVLSGHDGNDNTSARCEVPDYTKALTGEVKGLRIGVPKEYFVPGTDPEIEKSVRAAIAHLQAQGAELVEVSLPHTEYAIAVYYIIATAEASANLARFDGVRYGRRTKDAKDVIELYGKTRAEGFGPEVKRRIILGTYVLSSGYYDAYYNRAQKVRQLLRQDFEAAFTKCDVILTPTSPTAAFKIGEKVADPLQMYLADIFTIAVNLAGISGISLPCGFTASGLPIGLQMIGPAWGEETLFRTADAYERSTDWHSRRPNL
ncbi:aspartyl/glutamyl-tRNA(Asn/Gln) amidotransferase subunit A [Verrucomicrobium sp. GAS474]|uniref:Asp-tRNA(Asn)/Glu-tRNA(Gln) amidotransferase subunit GatA n=1 Tax=Verrucomicrobium sp. GAS474 TaxID=1882831 RepID=UPI00087D71B5|nr:Asp-tRNA(Asn)/Glu-tRNA(Gln) amidotransferase subunit GatA [Verrucomicrobium sp. GAS474]SDU21101.1 aspartyl/glutamyl-tRNA(Asn/Gln) amidotransferase subunit A [Verrucomicrobium sp. GAS474]